MFGHNVGMGDNEHTEGFARHVEARQSERDSIVRVTWRKVAPSTGGGWSGLGPDGRLVYTVPETEARGSLHEYGRVVNRRRVRGGSRMTMTEARAAAENIMRRDVAMSTEGGEMEVPTVESLMDGIEGGEISRPPKAKYARLMAGGRTLCYAAEHATEVLLDFRTVDVEEAPIRYQKQFDGTDGERWARGRSVMRVGATNAKTARGLLGWVARHV